MGMRFRKSIKIAPGVKVNVGKKSAGMLAGSIFPLVLVLCVLALRRSSRRTAG